MPVRGQRLVAKNIAAFGGGFKKHVDKTMEQVRVVLDKKVQENVTISDLSPADLIALDHPYASRHGEKGKTGVLPKPYYKVHTRTGELANSQYSGVIPSSIGGGKLEASAFVGLDESKAEHAEFVIYGTSKMIPRPVLTGSLSEVKGASTEILKRNLRGFVFQFKGSDV